MNISVPQVYEPMNMDEVCKNWRTDDSGTEVRMSPKQEAIIQLINAINRLLGIHTYRVIGNSAMPYQNGGSISDVVSPSHEFRTHDNWANARSRLVTSIHEQRTENSPASATSPPLFWIENASNSAEIGMKVSSRNDAAGFLSASFYNSLFSINRGDCSNTATSIFIGKRTDDTNPSSEGFSLADVAVCDTRLNSLRAELGHLAVQVTNVKSGSKILNNIMKQLINIFNELRFNNLMFTFPWSAHKITSGWASPATETVSSHKLFLIPNSQITYTNILDNTSSVRSNQTPGFNNFLRHCGRGDGTTVGIKVFVHGISTDASNLAKVKFLGPNDSIELTLPTTRGWVDSGATTLTMNTNVANNSTATGNNKIDIQAKHDASASGDSAIYGFFGQIITI